MISIIIPFYNEEGNLGKLSRELLHELDATGQPYEIIFVDDGSDDDSVEKREKNDHIRIISHRNRRGKGEGLNTGIHHAKGSIIVFMDGDLQNDPKDIPKLLKKLDEGYDFVNGIRDKRDDNSLIKIYSGLANSFLQSFVGSPFADVNCAFKAMKREVLDEVVLYSNNFRFLPLAVYFKGYKVAQVKIHNRPRLHGSSKFGTGKIFIGLIDTFTAYFIYRFSEKPLHFFGSIGGFFFGIGFAIALYLSYERIVYNLLLYRRPMLQFAVLLMIVGIQIIMTGFIGELIVYLDKKKRS